MELSVDQLKILLADIESDRVERTQSTGDTEKYSIAVCGFANDLSGSGKNGYLIIGVDKNGKPTGAKITENFLEALAGLRSDGNIQPLPVISVKKMILTNYEVAVVEVKPSLLPPVRYKGQVWIRVGPRRATASEQEEKILTERRIADFRSFDASPLTEASIQDLSMPLFANYRQIVVAREIIEANHRSPDDQLASLRLFSSKLSCATAAGIILLGKNPRYFLPGCYVQFLRLNGSQLTDELKSQDEISGDLYSIVSRFDLIVKNSIENVMISTSALHESVSYDYPSGAIREILMNAIIHRDYQSNTPIRFYWFNDRIEIMSPGGLYGEVTEANMRSQSSYRNPVIAEAMKALGYVNRFGYGLQKADRELEKNGNPPMTIKIEANSSVLVTIQKRTK